MFKKLTTNKQLQSCNEDNLIKQFYRNISCVVSTDESVQEVPTITSEATTFSQVLDDLLEDEVPQEYFDDAEEGSYVPFEPEMKNGCSKYNLILDLDGTLVHTLPCDVGSVFGEADFEDEVLDFYTFKRPGVDAFLQYCFSHFASVSVWTAGTHDYARYVVDHITPKGKQFLYILSRDNCSYHPIKPNTLVKDLRDIWDSFYGKELNINKDNTLIIDDNEEVCFHNMDNSLLVNTWGINTHGDNDDLLFKLMFHFERVRAEDAKSMCYWLSEMAM